MSFIYIFFFSSRRRHTRSLRDWSSDVCSSDLAMLKSVEITQSKLLTVHFDLDGERHSLSANYVWSTIPITALASCVKRSEERRVGKESRSTRLVGLLNDSKYVDDI